VKTLRVALAQIAPKLGQLEENLDLHARTLRHARREKADLVVFPELSLTGYLLRDQVPDVSVRAGSPWFRKIAALSRGVDVVVGFVEETAGHRYCNAAAFLSRGRLVHIHRKVYLPTYGMFDEGRDFAAGDRVRAFPTRFGPVGVLICEDLWHPMCAWLLAQQGAEILIAPSCGPTRGARSGRGITSVAVWHDLLCVTARFQTSFIVYVNRVGYEDGLSFGGGSTVADPFGRLVGSLPPIEEGLATVDLDAEVLRRARTAYPLLRDENLDLMYRELQRLRDLRYDLPGGAEGSVGRAQPGPARGKGASAR